MDPEVKQRIAIVGGGPAGLRAAEVIASQAKKNAVSITLFDAKPSVGRKLLVAGKGGLNLTNAEPVESFAQRFRGTNQPKTFWPSALEAFDAKALRAWAARHGTGTFQASSGRVYPKALKAAPLLRAWVRHLKSLGVEFAVNHRWTGLEPGSPLSLKFCKGPEISGHECDAIVLALGGGSWPSTGSNGAWLPILEALDIASNPLIAANCGWEVAWPPQWLSEVEGKPLKNIVVSAANREVAGELVWTRYGLEGGPIYDLGPDLRDMEDPIIHVDLKPTFTRERLVAKMESARRNFLDEARLRWKLSESACALLHHTHGAFTSASSLASVVKEFQIPLSRPRPIAEAISSAGGVDWREIDSTLMLRKIPGVFLAGEMIDWEAPTGGYLLQGSFATGTLAGTSLLKWIGQA